ncbi:MAG: hypothetical protein IJA10_15340 [Lachnospiraceae bacterium]|nr:hypothetical protein [Lachnospiraceae bacterium]
MAYVLRERNEADKEYFLQCGVESPFGGTPSFGKYIVENVEEDVKMFLLGGQGIMKEDGTEWSEMACYCAIIWKGKKYTVEFYSYEKWFEELNGKDKFESLYKIKCVCTEEVTDNNEKEGIIEIIKSCFTTYDFKRYKSSVCEKVVFMDENVKWI